MAYSVLGLELSIFGCPVLQGPSSRSLLSPACTGRSVSPDNRSLCHWPLRGLSAARVSLPQQAGVTAVGMKPMEGRERRTFCQVPAINPSLVWTELISAAQCLIN